MLPVPVHDVVQHIDGARPQSTVECEQGSGGSRVVDHNPEYFEFRGVPFLSAFRALFLQLRFFRMTDHAVERKSRNQKQQKGRRRTHAADREPCAEQARLRDYIVDQIRSDHVRDRIVRRIVDRDIITEIVPDLFLRKAVFQRISSCKRSARIVDKPGSLPVKDKDKAVFPGMHRIQRSFQGKTLQNTGKLFRIITGIQISFLADRLPLVGHQNQSAVIHPAEKVFSLVLGGHLPEQTGIRALGRSRGGALPGAAGIAHPVVAPDIQDLQFPEIENIAELIQNLHGFPLRVLLQIPAKKRQLGLLVSVITLAERLQRFFIFLHSLLDPSGLPSGGIGPVGHENQSLKVEGNQEHDQPAEYGEHQQFILPAVLRRHLAASGKVRHDPDLLLSHKQDDIIDQIDGRQCEYSPERSTDQPSRRNQLILRNRAADPDVLRFIVIGIQIHPLAVHTVPEKSAALNLFHVHPEAGDRLILQSFIRIIEQAAAFPGPGKGKSVHADRFILQDPRPGTRILLDRFLGERVSFNHECKLIAYRVGIKTAPRGNAVLRILLPGQGHLPGLLLGK